MDNKLKIDEEAIKTADVMLDVLIKDLKRIEDGDDITTLTTLGYRVLITPMDLILAPMALSVFEIMGQNGVKNIFFRGGSYFGKIYALQATSSGMAKWDESLLTNHENIHTCSGWGYLTYSEKNLDIENPRIVCFCKNHPCATVIPKIMEDTVGASTSLTVDYSQTFCDLHTGMVLSIARQILKNNGAKDEVLSRMKGYEDYCQAQEGRDHCRHVIGLLDR